jgi:hypothetical protein
MVKVSALLSGGNSSKARQRLQSVNGLHELKVDGKNVLFQVDNLDGQQILCEVESHGEGSLTGRLLPSFRGLTKYCD